jgi:hypothetical protein
MNIHSNTTTTSQVTASVGFQITGASTAGRYLRHNGTRYVDAAIQTADIPDLGANPSASVGLSAVNGVATTYLRSDSSPALSVAITPTWTGTHTFSNATYSALFSGGPVGVGIATPTAGLDIETVPASSKTFFKAGSVCPVYLVGSAAGSGSPAVGMNLYYDTAWKFGKGSSSNWGGALSFDYTSGTLAWYISSAAGTAAGAATLASIFSISAAGVVKVPGLTASRLVATDASSNMESVAAGTDGQVLSKVSGAIAWATPTANSVRTNTKITSSVTVAATHDVIYVDGASATADITITFPTGLTNGSTITVLKLTDMAYPYSLYMAAGAGATLNNAVTWAASFSNAGPACTWIYETATTTWWIINHQQGS